MSIMTIAFVLAVVAGGTLALFADTESSIGNTFTSGTLDLRVDNENGPLGAKFSTSNMVPGEKYHAGTVTLSNAGTVDGILTLMIDNPVSHENGILDAEADDGDLVDQEIDPSGYNANTGDGELWDQTTLRICLETGAGSHSTNNICDWDDTTLYNNEGTPGNDYSATYRLPIATDLAEDNHITLAAGDSVNLVVEVTFVDDQSNWWWGGMNGVTNNMAMSDDMVFDVIFGLKQVTP